MRIVRVSVRSLPVLRKLNSYYLFNQLHPIFSNKSVSYNSLYKFILVCSHAPLYKALRPSYCTSAPEAEDSCSLSVSVACHVGQLAQVYRRTHGSAMPDASLDSDVRCTPPEGSLSLAYLAIDVSTDLLTAFVGSDCEPILIGCCLGWSNRSFSRCSVYFRGSAVRPFACNFFFEPHNN